MIISRRDRLALARISAKIAKQQSDAMTPEQRSARASNAAKARWAKAKEAKRAMLCHNCGTADDFRWTGNDGKGRCGVCAGKYERGEL